MLGPTPFIGGPVSSTVVGTTTEFIPSNSMAYAGTIYQGPQMLPPVITSPIGPAVTAVQTTQNYQVFPPMLPTAYVQPPVTIVNPPLSSRGLLATGIRPITPPIGLTTPQVVPLPGMGLAGSRILGNSRVVIAPPGCCPECFMCGACCGMCGPAMCGPQCCALNGCCGGMGCAGMGCGYPCDNYCSACWGCRCCYF